MVSTSLQARFTRHGRRILGWSGVASALLLIVLAARHVASERSEAATRAESAAREAVLRSDVAAINAALRRYFASGRTVERRVTAEQVLEFLTSAVPAEPSGEAATDQPAKPFLDPRVRGRSSTTERALRATWDGKFERFTLQSGLEGFTEFYLAPQSDASGSRPSGTGNTEGAPTVKNRLRDGDDTARTSQLSDENTVASGASTLLQPPKFSIPGGIYPHEQFPLSLSLSDPNHHGRGRIFYAVNGGPWVRYKDAAITLPRDALETSVSAYVSAVDREAASDSETRTEYYRTFLFIGKCEAVFEKPLGGPAMVATASGGGANTQFEWGRAQPQHPAPNKLTFSAARSFVATPEQTFVLGDIVYQDGKTIPASNAASVELRLRLTFAVPQAEETVSLRLRLAETQGSSVPEANPPSGYLWIPARQSNLKMNLHGRSLAVTFSLRSAARHRFATDDELTVDEGRSLTATLLGTLHVQP